MEPLFPLFLLLLAIITIDKKIIDSLQRKGTYNPDTHKTFLSQIFGVLLYPFTSNGKHVIATTGVLPKGDIKSFKVIDRTICMNELSSRTRLTYFTDENNHAWFKKERINSEGKLAGKTFIEPATMTFKQQSSLLI